MNTIEQSILEKAGEAKKVFMLVSGGVDSTVAFSMLNKSFSNTEYQAVNGASGCISTMGSYVTMNSKKSSFMQVQSLLTQCGFTNFKAYDARDTFIHALKEVYLPEEKRKVIGETFIEVQKQALKEMNLDPDVFLLGQGTIYPDTIESKGTQHSHLIKTHHNRVEVIQTMIEQGKVIEPLQDLYKDEVRNLGMLLGLPEPFVYRHPFPGPGLGVRCLCVENTQETITHITLDPQTLDLLQ